MLNPLPNLDDRRWADLVEEGRALIPLYARDWTDHNIHDPGITITEALASVAEMDIYMLNRVPERHQRKFLKLVGIAPEPPAAAKTVLRFTMKSGAAPLPLPAGTAFATVDSEGADLPFRLMRDVVAVPGELGAVLVREGRVTADYSQRLAHGESVPAFGTAETTGAELYLGFTEPLPAGAWTTIYIGIEGRRASETERNRILAEARDQARACAPPPNPCATSEPPAPKPVALPPHQSARIAWEYLDAAGGWTAAEARDDTRSLTLSGSVSVRPGAAMAPGGIHGGPADLYYLRCRFVSGAFDAAPVVSRIVLNGGEAEQTTTTPTTAEAEGDGSADQSISLPFAPVVASSVNVISIEQGHPREWIRRADFDSSGRADRHYVLDAGAGVVFFGDGERGLAPAPRSIVRVSCLVTRAAEGSLPEGRVFRLIGHLPHDEDLAAVDNAIPAAGGLAVEPVIAAAGRAVQMLREPSRAVTAADYEALALETPGTDLSRVAVAPNCHPSFECIEAPGVITVIPITRLPDRAPMPSSGTLALVRRYLNRRRIIGVRVEVVAPQYATVTVRASVRALPGASPVMLRQRVAEALDGFLHPLRGGPGGDGWPAGRDVYRSEILQVIDGVSGVDHTLSLELQAGACGPVCGNVCVPALWLVTPGAHEIRVV